MLSDLSFSVVLHSATTGLELLLWLSMVVGGLVLRGQHPGAGTRLSVGAALLLLATLLGLASNQAVQWIVADGELASTAWIWPLVTCSGLVRVAVRSLGLAFVAWAAVVGRRSWYEEELATPLPGDGGAP